MTSEPDVLTESLCAKDHALWTEEIAAWKQDHARALAMLEETATFIHRHEAELEEHLRDIQVHEKMQRTGEGGREALREHHLEVKRRHNGFRGRHRGLMDEVLKLRVALHKAAHGAVFD